MQYNDKGTGNMGNTAETNEHNETEEAKLKTLNVEHKTVKIQQETLTQTHNMTRGQARGQNTDITSHKHRHTGRSTEVKDTHGA